MFVKLMMFPLFSTKVCDSLVQEEGHGVPSQDHARPRLPHMAALNHCLAMEKVYRDICTGGPGTHRNEKLRSWVSDVKDQLSELITHMNAHLNEEEFIYPPAMAQHLTEREWKVGGLNQSLQQFDAHVSSENSQVPLTSPGITDVRLS